MLWVTKNSWLYFPCYAFSTKVRMAGYWPSLNSFVDWDEVNFNKSTEKNQISIHAAILTKQLWLIRDLLPYKAKNRTFSSGTNAGNPERPILPTQGGGGASLPSFFFSLWIFLPRSTIWTQRTGYTKGHKKKLSNESIPFTIQTTTFRWCFTMLRWPRKMAVQSLEGDLSK